MIKHHHRSRKNIRSKKQRTRKASRGAGFFNSFRNVPIKNVKNVPKEDQDALFMAIKNGNEQEAIDLIKKKGVNPNLFRETFQKNERGRGYYIYETPLKLAIQKNLPKLVLVLIQKGAEPNLSAQDREDLKVYIYGKYGDKPLEGKKNILEATRNAGTGFYL